MRSMNRLRKPRNDFRFQAVAVPQAVMAAAASVVAGLTASTRPQAAYDGLGGLEIGGERLFGDPLREARAGQHPQLPPFSRRVLRRRTKWAEPPASRQRQGCSQLDLGSLRQHRFGGFAGHAAPGKVRRHRPTRMPGPQQPSRPAFGKGGIAHYAGFDKSRDHLPNQLLRRDCPLGNNLLPRRTADPALHAPIQHADETGPRRGVTRQVCQRRRLQGGLVRGKFGPHISYHARTMPHRSPPGNRNAPAALIRGTSERPERTS